MAPRTALFGGYLYSERIREVLAILPRTFCADFLHSRIPLGVYSRDCFRQNSCFPTERPTHTPRLGYVRRDRGRCGAKWFRSMSITVCAFLHVQPASGGISPPPEKSMTATAEEQHLPLGVGFIKSRTKVIRCLNSVALPETAAETFVIGSWSIIWDSGPKQSSPADSGSTVDEFINFSNNICSHRRRVRRILELEGSQVSRKCQK